jgi:hypothetical protein
MIDAGGRKYKVENLGDEVGIFCFEGGFEVSRVWIVLDIPWVE